MKNLLALLAFSSLAFGLVGCASGKCPFAPGKKACCSQGKDCCSAGSKECCSQ